MSLSNPSSRDILSHLLKALKKSPRAIQFDPRKISESDHHLTIGNALKDIGLHGQQETKCQRSNLVNMRLDQPELILILQDLCHRQALSSPFVIRMYMSRDMTKPTKWLCAQRRLRSAWASPQSD